MLRGVLHRCIMINKMFLCLQSLNLFSDLMTVLDRNVDELSGGELQRFACAVVCIQKADM